MVPLPVVLGLSVCERVIVEEGTQNLTLVSCFTKMLVDQFPSQPCPLAAMAAFRDGLGNANIELVITHADSDEEVYSYRGTIQFPDRLTEVRAIVRINNCTFPTPGRYQFTLLIDGEGGAQRQIRVALREASR